MMGCIEWDTAVRQPCILDRLFAEWDTALRLPYLFDRLYRVGHSTETDPPP